MAGRRDKTRKSSSTGSDIVDSDASAMALANELDTNSHKDDVDENESDEEVQARSTESTRKHNHTRNDDDLGDDLDDDSSEEEVTTTKVFPTTKKRKVDDKPKDLKLKEKDTTLSNISMPTSMRAPARSKKKKDEHVNCRGHVDEVSEDAEAVIETLQSKYEKHIRQWKNYSQNQDDEILRLLSTIAQQNKVGKKLMAEAEKFRGQVVKKNDAVISLRKEVKTIKAALTAKTNNPPPPPPPPANGNDQFNPQSSSSRNQPPLPPSDPPPQAEANMNSSTSNVAGENGQNGGQGAQSDGADTDASSLPIPPAQYEFPEGPFGPPADDRQEFRVSSGP